MIGVHPDRKRQLDEYDSNYSSKGRPGIGNPERRSMDHASFGVGSSMITEDIMVPGDVVGLIIGRGGDTLKRIQSEAHVKLQIDQENRDAPQRRITIMASSQSDVEKARQLIEDIIHPSQRGGGKQTVHMNLPFRLVGFVIGRGGEMIRELQEKSGAKVHVDPNLEPVKGERVVNITGDNASIEKAKQLIQEIISGVNPF
jgi:far upstream element-binding protein